MGTRKPHRPTLRDVAREADVSIWTASTTFSNPGRVAEATRQRVLAAADTLGYGGPNPGARALALGAGGLVSLTTAGDPDRLLSDPVAAQIAQGVLTACARAGRSLVLAGDESNDNHLIEGLILFRARHDGGDRRPSVRVLPEVDDATVPCVRADLAAGIERLVSLLTDLGHRRFVILSTAGDDERLNAVGSHLGGAGPLEVIRAGGDDRWPSRAAGEAAARHALSSEARPTAVLALNDTLAFGALEAAHRLGLRVPNDLSVVGIDDIPGADLAGLTTLLVPYRPLGELAAELLLRQLEGDRTRATPPALPTALRVRTSAGPPP